jgi:parallel beta-helix repeat protein
LGAGQWTTSNDPIVEGWKMKNILIASIALILVIGLIIPAAAVPVRAETIWTVDDDGVENPYADYNTIQAAINAASAGDSIIVYQGTYTESVSVTKQLTIRAASSVKPVINGGGINIYYPAANVIIDGFEITGASTGIYISGSSNNIINNTLKNNTSDGILVIQTNAYGNNIEGNEISGSNRGIHLLDSNNNEVKNNLVYSNDSGIWVDDSTNIDITGNTIKENSDDGVLLFGDVSGTIINFNIIVDNNIGINSIALNTVDATNNWWGDATGPYHFRTNPDGLGDSIFDSTRAPVIFNPWITMGVGEYVTVTLDCATVTFDNVIGVGDTSCTTQQGNPYGVMPEGFRVRGQFVDVVTDATYDQPGVEVCIPYNPSEPNPENLKLFHWEGNWVDRTTHVDTDNHYVCGYVTSLSWFFIGGEWVWIDDATGVPVFPSVYIGIVAALGAGVLAYLLRRRVLGRKTTEI